VARISYGRMPTLLAAEDPQRIAFVCEEESIRRGDLERRANRTARAYAQSLHAIVETAHPLRDDELCAHVAERLAPYKNPRSFEYVDRPLRDDAGKVRRSALREERIARPHPERPE
jgi:hypothetical protein